MRSLISFFYLLFPLWLYAINPVVRNTNQGIELRNNHVSIIISDDAEMVSCVDLETGADIALHDHSKIAYAKGKDGNVFLAKRVSLEDDKIHLILADKTIDLAVNAYDDYFTIEVIGSVPSTMESLTFLDLKMKYDFLNSQAFMATGVAMTLQTDPVYYPSGEKKNVVGRCYSLTGYQGAKLAVVACKKDCLRGIIKTIYESIPSGTIPINRTGGPFALENDVNKNDCALIGDVKPSQLPKLIDFYSQYGIKQFEFLQGSSNFIQGQFSFIETGSAQSFKREITDPLDNVGISSLLHTYSYYISYKSDEILSNPKWQQQLEFREGFTLSSPISKTVSSLELSGDMSLLKDNNEFWSIRTPYMLIDDEIVKFTIGKQTITCQRGQCGTHASAHKAGTRVRIIGGQFSHIAPQIGSELFYEVARRTAKAYNEGGFSGIYFDAFDGLGVHLKHAGLSDYLWYYGASFINEVLKYCRRAPVVEYSNMMPTVWSGRGRGESWDTPNRGYKNFIDDHMKMNKVLANRFYVTTLGWYNFYPMQKGFPGNYATKYMFSDDVDYIGVKTIAYDQTMVYNGLTESDVESIPALRRNMEFFCRYSRLRAGNYFSDEVKTILREGKFEYKLDRKSGAWGFFEAHYCRNKLRDIAANQMTGNNPFKSQKPFVRLENMYSSDLDSSIPLISSDNLKDFINQKCEIVFPTPINMSKHLGLRVSIKGNGGGSTDAICVRLCSSPSSGYADYVVRLNFDGWRDILLTDLDNAENPDLLFREKEDINYKMHRKSIDFSNISYACIYKSADCKDVMIKKIEAVPLTPNPLLNPCVHLGNSSITFKDTIQSGEYIEYQAGSKTAAVYDSIGNARTISAERRGQFKVPSGQFTARVTGTSKIKNAPSEVVLTFGLYGKFIHN